MDDLAVKRETRAMARTIPAPVGLVPAKDAAHMGADRRHRVEPALLVPESRDVVAVDLEDRRLARSEIVEAVRLSRQPAPDQM